MITKHPYVGNDFSDDNTIWKYFPLPAFLALLEDKMLYFTRASYLTDPYEFPITEKDAEQFLFSMDDYKKTIEQIKAKTFINCWRISDYESFGMWNAYSDSTTGIAIKTDVKSLFESFKDIQPDIPTVYAMRVKYVDSLKETTQNPGDKLNLEYIVTTKTKPYLNECELRLKFEDAHKKFEEGSYIGVSVDTKTLIKEVFVGSSSEPYVPNLITKILNRYGINSPVMRSIVK